MGSPRTNFAGHTVACDADGTKVAMAFEQQIDVLETSNGRIKTLANLLEASSTLASSIAWEPKGDGFIISATMNLPGFHDQLFHVSYPEGTVRRITNDLSNYLDISISADGKTVSSTKVDGVSSFYLWSKARAAARKLDTIKNPAEFGWLDNDRLLFSTSLLDLGMANLATGETKIINTDQRQSYWLPSACGDKSVVFSSKCITKPPGQYLEDGSGNRHAGAVDEGAIRCGSQMHGRREMDHLWRQRKIRN